MVTDNKNDTIVFWGCFIALITTAFGFISRMFLINTWGEEFGLDPAQTGRLAGIGIWPFAVSIIGFSLLIDRIGYKVSMVIAFLGHIIWAIMGVSAYYVSKGGDPKTAFQLLYWGSLILALGNGTVEAFINPVVATMFSKEKTKWLNILHAGWPGGLVVAGIIVIFMGDMPWGYKVGTIALPAVIYLLLLLPRTFPVHERVTSGVSYREMLSEFGVLGAAIVGTLVTLQLMDFFSNGGATVLSTTQKGIFIGIGAAIILAFGLYTRAIGRALMFVLVLVMIPLATTEIGTDGWITGIMEGVAKEKFHPGWILVYTSAIMMVLRFFAGPIVHSLSPLGLLAISAVLAIVGLTTLSFTTGVMIFVAATLYGVGKTFFWPTMLGVVSEQTPKGGALTLNAISGIGMLAVGTLGFPYIGTLQADKQISALVTSEEAKDVPGLVENGALTTVQKKSIYEVIHYTNIDDDKLKELLSKDFKGDAAELEKVKQERAKEGKPVKDDEVVLTGAQKQAWDKIAGVRSTSNQKALASMAIFPAIMLIAYIFLIFYFKSTGGYKAEVLVGHEAEDEKFTGGVEAAVE